MPQIYIISFKIDGCGTATVEADSEEEAIQKAKDGKFVEDPEIDEWEINTREYSGGYIDAVPER